MARKYSEAVRDVCGALSYEGLGVPEIERRLHANEAGLGSPCEIKERRIYEYIKDYEIENGPRPDQEDEDQSADSIFKLKRRGIALMAREITALEHKRAGTITADQSRTLRQHIANLEAWERRDEEAARRRLRSAREGKGNGKEQDDPPESMLAKIAREEREGNAAEPGATDGETRPGVAQSHRDESGLDGAAEEEGDDQAGGGDRLAPDQAPSPLSPGQAQHAAQRALSSVP